MVSLIGIGLVLWYFCFPWHARAFTRNSPFQGDSSVSALNLPVDSAAWRTERRCGINALYVLLSICNQRVGYDSLVSDFSSSNALQDASLLTIIRISNSHGVPLAAVKTGPEGLIKAPKPGIAHYESESGDVGHYVLVLDADMQGVVLMDGTDLSIMRYSWRYFATRWSGNLLVRSTSVFQSTNSMWHTVLMLVGAMLSGALIDHRLGKWRKTRMMTKLQS